MIFKRRINVCAVTMCFTNLGWASACNDESREREDKKKNEKITPRTFVFERITRGQLNLFISFPHVGNGWGNPK
jgi:hypothetical protein